MLRLDELVLRQGAFELRADVTFAAGTCTALIGPSGAGKSTVLAGIAGFLAPRSGKVVWQGEDLSTVTPGARPMSMLFQDGNLFPHLTVFQNVGLGLSPALRLGPLDRDRIAQVIARVGLQGLMDRKPSDLSGGQMARVALARVMLRARPLMILDEPFAALGPALKAEMLDLVQEVARAGDATVLMVSHDPEDAKRIADHCVLVADGRVAPPVPTDAFFDAPPAVLSAYLGT